MVSDAFSRGLLVAGAIAVVLAVLAWLRMSSTNLATGAGMHMHH